MVVHREEGGSGRCQISYFDAELGQYGLPQQGLALKKKKKKKFRTSTYIVDMML